MRKFRDHQITDILKLNMYTSVNLLIHNIFYASCFVTVVTGYSPSCWLPNAIKWKN